jgi:hypothetical protein
VSTIMHCRAGLYMQYPDAYFRNFL